LTQVVAFLRPKRLGRTVGRARGEGQRTAPVSGTGGVAAAQGGVGSVPQGAARRAVRPGIRAVALGRDEHVLRGRSAGQSPGAARLLAGPPAGLQAGLHRVGGLALRDAAGIRGLRGQPGRRDDRRGDRRDDGTPLHRDWAALPKGCYLLRSNIHDWSDEELWKTYIQLTEAEAAFRVHKSDLAIPLQHLGLRLPTRPMADV